MDHQAVTISDKILREKILLRLTDEYAMERQNIENYEKLLKVYFYLGDMLSGPTVLNDPKKRGEYDKYHNELCASNEFAFYVKRDWMKSSYFL